MRGWAVVILALLLAGCTRAPPDAVAQDAAPTGATEGFVAARAVPFAALPTERLSVDLSVEERWVRPSDAVVASVASKASAYEWYLAPRNPLHALRDPGPFFLPEQGLQTLDVRREGRHVFGVDGAEARLSVSTIPGALPLRLDVRLVEDARGLRFAPDELVGGPGSVVSLASDLPRHATVQRLEAMTPLQGDGNGLRFHLRDVVGELGDYELVVIARDGAGAVGNASALLIYDNRKPDAEHTFGPYSGRFQLPPMPTGGATARHALESAHPLAMLDVTLSHSSSAPLPAALRMTLQAPDGAVIVTTEADGLTATGLPAGEYTLAVEHLSGAAVEYRIDAEGLWDLHPPASFFHRS